MAVHGSGTTHSLDVVVDTEMTSYHREEAVADAITQEDRDRVALDTHNYFNSQKSGRLIFLFLYINVYIYI